MSRLVALLLMLLLATPAFAETVHFPSATTPPTPLQQRLANRLDRVRILGMRCGSLLLKMGPLPRRPSPLNVRLPHELLQTVI